MCLIFTVIAAVAFSAAFFATRKIRPDMKSVATAALMFWAAALT